MLTKDQWDGMTPQAQWDFVQSLMADVEAHEAETDTDGMSFKEVRERYFPNRSDDDLTNYPTLHRIRTMPEEEFNQLFPSFDGMDTTG